MTVYEDINSLEEISFIGGNNYTLNFSVYDEDNLPLDINAATCEWKMCEYGNPDLAVLTKSGTITGLNTWSVEIASSDTITLSGKYIHQPVVIDFFGNEFPSQQGIITIIPRIQ